MTILQYYKRITQNQFIRNHVLVIIVFTIITGIFTYPSYLEFDMLIGNHGDPDVSMNTFWWYDHNVKNLHKFDFHWIFYNDYQFYPKGSPLQEDGTLSSLMSIPLVPILKNYVHVYNVIMYCSFIFSGYGVFLLARHVVKNYFSSMIAGMIFSFGTFHLWHATGHLTISTIEFIPFAILFLIKTTESKSVSNFIIGGIFLSLVFISSFYIGFFMGLFLIAFLLYLLLKKENVLTFLRISLLFVMAISITGPFYYEHFKTNPGNIISEPISSFVFYSVDLTNFFLPTPTNTFANIIHFPWHNFGDGETWAFLGYTSIILAIIGIVKSTKNEKLLWIISGVFLALISMGPFLKINGITTHLPLLDYFLYNSLPGFDLFRTIGRANIFVVLSVSILAAFGMNQILKFSNSTKKKILVITLIGIFVIIELLTIPFPTDAIPVSLIYEKIASDPSNTVVLETPIGRGDISIQDDQYGSNEHYSFFQTVHGKPIYSGHQPRPPEETQRYVQTYFLNFFIWDQPSSDIIKQDMHDVGISILNYYNIGYVIVHNKTQPGVLDIIQEHVTKSWIPQTKYLLNEIFSKAPDYEDGDLFAYQVPTSKSKTPFVVLGEGWNPLWTDYRTIGKTGSIVIINPNDTVVRADLNIEFDSFVNNTMTFLFNGNKVSDISTNAGKSYQILIPLELRPNSNTVEILTQNEIPSEIPNFEGKLHSIAVDSISLNTRSPYIGTFHVGTSNYTSFANRTLTESEINELYNKILGRNVDAIGLKNWMIESTKPGHDYHWLEQQLRNSDEFKMYLKGN